MFKATRIELLAHQRHLPSGGRAHSRKRRSPTAMSPRRAAAPEIIRCKLLPQTKNRIEEYADQLRDAAYSIGTHGLSEQEFLDSGLFHAAIERLRGQQAALMTTKRKFVSAILDYMRSRGEIISWKFTGQGDRHDYQINMPNGRLSVIEAKGCLDGNNTTIFERPNNADEFLIWSLCQNPGASPNKNAWSGIHTRLSAEIISRGQKVDALIIWDSVCGTTGRPCPKLAENSERGVTLNEKSIPPPCIYLFPRSIPDPRNNPRPKAHQLKDVLFANALYNVFGCDSSDVVSVSIEARSEGADVQRRSIFSKNDEDFAESQWTSIRRTR